MCTEVPMKPLPPSGGLAAAPLVTSWSGKDDVKLVYNIMKHKGGVLSARPFCFGSFCWDSIFCFPLITFVFPLALKLVVDEASEHVFLLFFSPWTLLQFPGKKDEESVCTLTLTNTSEKTVAYKVKHHQSIFLAFELRLLVTVTIMNLPTHRSRLLLPCATK